MLTARHRLYFTALAFCFGLALLAGPAVPAQAPSALTPAQAEMTDALNALQPLLAQVNASVSAVDVHRWKVPNGVRDTTSSDVQSIQRDLTTTLPGLLNQAQAASGSVAPAFAVYRNIDALYDVLLRITETATLAGTQAESGRLEGTRSELQARRAQLGNAILASASAQDNNVIQLKSSLAAASRTVATVATPPKKVVVDDGPSTSTAKVTRKKKPAATKPADNPATQQ